MTHLRNLLLAIQHEATFNAMADDDGTIAEYWYTPAVWDELVKQGRVVKVDGQRGYRVVAKGDGE